jgi:hypothetical protein
VGVEVDPAVVVQMSLRAVEAVKVAGRVVGRSSSFNIAWKPDSGTVESPD